MANTRSSGRMPQVPVMDGSKAEARNRRSVPEEFRRPTDEENRRAGLERVHGVPDREATREAARAEASKRLDAADSDAIFYAGFDAGERFGYTFGFHNGGAEVANQLLAPGRGQRYLEGSTTGNRQGRPRNAFEEHTQDQLTAEIAGLLAAYSILPTAVKVRATLDALKSLGVTMHDMPGND